MPLESHQLIKEADEQLVGLRATSTKLIRAMQDFVAGSRAMESASRRRIDASCQLLADTLGVAGGYKGTVDPPWSNHT